MAERVGFEPTDAFTSPVFKTGAFDHSAISPDIKAAGPLPQSQSIVYHEGARFVNKKKTKISLFFEITSCNSFETVVL